MESTTVGSSMPSSPWSTDSSVQPSTTAWAPALAQVVDDPVEAPHAGTGTPALTPS